MIKESTTRGLFFVLASDADGFDDRRKGGQRERRSVKESCLLSVNAQVKRSSVTLNFSSIFLQWYV